MAARLHAIFATYASIQNEPRKQPFYLLGTDLIKTLRIRNSHKFTKSDRLRTIANYDWRSDLVNLWAAIKSDRTIMFFDCKLK